MMVNPSRVLVVCHESVIYMRTKMHSTSNIDPTSFLRWFFSMIAVKKTDQKNYSSTGIENLCNDYKIYDYSLNSIIELSSSRFCAFLDNEIKILIRGRWAGNSNSFPGQFSPMRVVTNNLIIYVLRNTEVNNKKRNNLYSTRGNQVTYRKCTKETYRNIMCLELLKLLLLWK